MQITQDVARKVLDVVDAGLSSGPGLPEPGYMCVEAAVCYALGLPHGDDPQCVAQTLRSLKIRLNDAGWSSKIARAKGLRRLAVAQLGSAGHLDEREFVRRVVDYAIRVSTPNALRVAAGVIKNPDHKAAMIAAAARCEKDGTRQAVIAGKTAAVDAAAYAADAAANANAAADAADAYAAYAAATAARAATDAAADAATDAYAAYADAYAAYAATIHAAASAAAHSTTAANAAAYAADAAATDAAAAADAYAAARDKSLADYAEAVVQILIEMKAPGCQWLELTEAA